jgi:hypothetical protein
MAFVDAKFEGLDAQQRAWPAALKSTPLEGAVAMVGIIERLFSLSQVAIIG